MMYAGYNNNKDNNNNTYYNIIMYRVRETPRTYGASIQYYNTIGTDTIFDFIIYRTIRYTLYMYIFFLIFVFFRFLVHLLPPGHRLNRVKTEFYCWRIEHSFISGPTCSSENNNPYGTVYYVYYALLHEIAAAAVERLKCVTCMLLL